MKVFTVSQLLVIGILWGGIGYVIGKFSERESWNNLIRRGIIPKPKGSKGKP